VSGTIKICGKRGLVVFCPECKDWVKIIMCGIGSGAHCACCRKRLPEIPTYTEQKTS